MRVFFTKMQGAGNDFVVLDETRGVLGLEPWQYRLLADRHFGIGADQILSVRQAFIEGVDFEYVIHNADGSEVEHCGNGARAFMRYVRERGLTNQRIVRVKIKVGVIELTERASGGITVNMGPPNFDLNAVAFNPSGMIVRAAGDWQLWSLRLGVGEGETEVRVAVLSMGNPHAVTLVEDVDVAPVEEFGPLIERNPAFAYHVNVGFMQVIDRSHVRLRVYERGVGETLACGTGACAAVVAGIRLGLLDHSVEVQVRGGRLQITWSGGAHDAVWMTGPAETVFEGSIELPEVCPSHLLTP